ncbi:MAG: TetR/AcrR family transcriptional regulator [Acidimicrobiia bacterium]
MTSQSHDEASTRPNLSRQRVVLSAVAYADGYGLDALSMRKLGNELGVEAMSLYNHVANKDDLVAGMIDLAMSEIDLPDPSGDWKTELEKSSHSAHDTLVAHPWIAGILMKPIAATPHRFDYMEAVLATLRSGGLSIELTHHAFHAIETHTIGYTMQEVAFDYDEETIKTAASDFLKTLDVDRYQYLAEHINHHINPTDNEEKTFSFGLRLILDGIERIRDHQVSLPV